MSTHRSPTICDFAAGATAACLALLGFAGSAIADETCQSPYLPKITGQEDFVYV